MLVVVTAGVGYLALGAGAFRPSASPAAGVERIELLGPVDLPEHLLRPDQEVGPAVGQIAPDFSLEDLQGRPYRLSDLRGRVVWVNWWATWCVPCRVEMPHIVELHREHKDRGLAVVALNLAEDREPAAGFIKEFKMDFPSLLDAQGLVARRYLLTGMPSHFFLDRDGVVRETQVGLMTKQTMVTKLQRAGLSLE